MAKALDIIVLVDESTIVPADPQFEVYKKEAHTEYDVIETLRNMGHTVRALGASSDLAALVSGLTEQQPDLVFNLTEHIEGDRLMDKSIAGLLEITGIPYTGAGPSGLMLCRDKRLSKELLSHHKIRVPRFTSFPLNRVFRAPKKLTYPLVVKPAFEDGSEGISNASLVANENSLRERVEWVRESWGQPAIAEEYIAGRELYVTVLGNKRLTVLPPRECLFGSDGDEGPQMATFRVKYNDKYRKKWNIEFGFANLEEDDFQAIARLCKRIYRVMQLRDYARIDLRLTPEGKIVVLEVNPNPDLAYGEEVAESAEKANLSYEQLIRKIVRHALARYE